MKKILFFLTGSLLCSLVMAVLYLAYAQENGNGGQNQSNVAPVGGQTVPGETAVKNQPARLPELGQGARPGNGQQVGTTNGAGGQVAPVGGQALNHVATQASAAAQGAMADKSPEASPRREPHVTNGLNGNGRTIDLMIGGDQVTNAIRTGVLEGASTNLISIALDGVPVQDVVNMFAQISGANIITSGSFSNIFVTANLKNVEWKTALNLALGSVNLAMIEDPSGILMVVTSEMYKQKIQQIEETKPLVTRTFTPKYLRAVDLIEQIKLLKLLSPRGTIITSQSKEQDKISLKSTATGTATESTAIQNPSITTAVIVSDIKEYVDKVEALVLQLDQREPQVFIEARIIDVGITYNQKLGFDWSMLEKFGASASLKDASWKYSDDRKEINTTDNRDYQYDKRANNDGLNNRYDMHGQQYEESTTTYEESPPGSGNWISRTVITPTRTISDTINRGRDLTSDRKDNIVDTFAEGKMGTMVLSATDVALYLSALRTTGHADVLSHPVLIVGNRVEAKIHVGEQTWKISLKRDTTNTGSAPMDRYSEDASPIDLGLKLWVIPEIDEANDAVRMTIEPEMTVFIRNITTPQGSVYPVTSTRRISTRVSIPNSHTVVIGGLIENKKAKNEKRVPLLGDIPLLGYLFRHTEDVDEKHNLLIMLSPTILDERKPVTGMEAIAQLTVNKFEQAPLAPIKNMPTNQVASQSLATNSVTPSSGLAPAAPAAPDTAGKNQNPASGSSANQAPVTPPPANGAD